MDKANKVKRPNIVRGGIAIPLGRNYYYMAGRKHKNGGIDIGKNPRTGLEVEDGEVMHIGKNEVKVFSSVPFLNGKSPAQKVMGGENPNKVFNQQEEFKDRNNINDDGTKKGNTNKAKMGTIDWNKVDEYADTAEKTLGAANLGLSAATIAAPNPYTAAGAYGTGLAGIITDVYQGVRSGIKGDWPSVGKNAVDIGLSLIGMRALKAAKKWNDLDKAKKAAGIQREYVTRTIGRRPKTRHKIKVSKERNAAEHNYMLGYGSIPMSTFLNFVDPTKLNNKNNTNDKKAMGGLSHSKDYGSKSKPYPSVKSGDFAGGHRSYPIPTKTDAIDALRLAGLYGRSDVRAKVYAKYSDLRKKSKSGGLYTLSVNGKQRLKSYPSTGKIELSKRQELTGTAVMRNGGRRKAYMGINDDLVKGNDTTAPDYSNNTNPFTLTENTANPVLERNNEPISSTNVPRAFARRNRDITDPEKLSIAYQKESGTYPNWFKRTYRNVKDYVNKHPETVIDEIGLGSNIIGGLISHKMNRDMLNKLKYNSEPIARKAAKLKTRININPQLDKMRETLAAYERNIDSNTASSRVALARKQRARFANMLSTNELYGSKENIETELINKDKLNQQSVADANIRDYNDWSEKKAAFNNAILEKKGENDVSLINTINTGVQDVINREEKRKSEKQTRLAFMAANPNVNPRILKIMGIKGITDEDIEAYDKAYGKKKKGKKSSDNN